MNNISYMQITNDAQYADLFLAYERHYPKFLDPFKNKTCIELTEQSQL